MTEIEKLAREICWREFTPPRTFASIGHTKAEYWAQHVALEKKQEYTRDAKFLIWALKNIPAQMLPAQAERSEAASPNIPLNK